MANMNFTSRFYALQSAFWLMYFIWQTWFSLLVFKASLSKRITLRQPYAYPLAVYFAWLIFSVFFSAAIYGDDWSFVRVLALMNIAGFAVMVAFRQTLNRYFVLFSIMMVALTVIRMILRP
jgi:small-conductance mechanosensitive channel